MSGASTSDKATAASSWVVCPSRIWIPEFLLMNRGAHSTQADQFPVDWLKGLHSA